MTSLPGFTVDIDQNPYLPAGGRDVSAIVTVTADETGDAPSEVPPDGGDLRRGVMAGRLWHGGDRGDGADPVAAREVRPGRAEPGADV